MIIRENQESTEKHRKANIIHHSTINLFYAGLFFMPQKLMT